MSLRPWKRPADRGRRHSAHHDSIPSPAPRDAPPPDAHAAHDGAPAEHPDAPSATHTASYPRNLSHAW